MNIINAALVGYGFAGRTFHAPLLERTPGLHLHTIVSSKRDQVIAAHTHARVVPRIEDVCKNPAIDLVVIATPNDTHAAMASVALAHGKHVVIDKPFATSRREAAQLVEQARAIGKLVTAFQNRRWDADFLTLRGLYHRGTLGEIVELESHFDRYRPQVQNRWRERSVFGSGTWFDLGPHLVDQALQLFGMPAAVWADITHQRPDSIADDYFNVILVYAQRRVVLRATSLAIANTLRFVAQGTKGSFVKHGLDSQESALRSGAMPGDDGWGEDPERGTLTTMDGGTPLTTHPDNERGDYREFYAAMADAIANGSPPPVTPQQVLDVMQVLDCAVESSATRCEVMLHKQAEA